MYPFFKENIVLVLGISLPLLLVVLFMLASSLPQIIQSDPKYDFLFSEGSNDSVEFKVARQKVYFKIAPTRSQTEIGLPHLFRYHANTKKVQEILFTPPDLSRQVVCSVSEQNSSNTSVVVSVDPNKLPSAKQARDTSQVVSTIHQGHCASHSPWKVPVTELSGLNLVAAGPHPVAPDGYSLTYGHYDGGNNFIFWMGPSTSQWQGPILTKNGKNIPIVYHYSDDHGSYASNESGGYYTDERGVHLLNLIGWIIP